MACRTGPRSAIVQRRGAALIVVSSDAKAQPDIYNAVTLAGTVFS